MFSRVLNSWFVFESLFTLLDQQQPLLRQMTHRVRVEVVPHTTNTTKNTFLQGLVNYAPLTLFGFCAILLDVVFEAPSAINCLTILNSADWTKMPEKVIHSLSGVRQHYNLVIAYAVVKGACIALQVWALGISKIVLLLGQKPNHSKVVCHTFSSTIKLHSVIWYHNHKQFFSRSVSKVC